MKLCIAVWHCHEGWLSDTGQAIVFLHQRLDFLGCHILTFLETLLHLLAVDDLESLAQPLVTDAVIGYGTDRTHLVVQMV